MYSRAARLGLGAPRRQRLVGNNGVGGMAMADPPKAVQINEEALCEKICKRNELDFDPLEDQIYGYFCDRERCSRVNEIPANVCPSMGMSTLVGDE